MTLTGLDLFTRTARSASAQVITAYSTSFGLASRLLTPRSRGQIADIYALVRIADEIVDGPAAEAGLSPAEKAEMLDELEAETLRAMARGFSANMVVHAFAATARETGIQSDIVIPFFASMRMDLDEDAVYDDAAYRRYIHGSAEVVGSMCLRVFAQEGRGIRIDDGLDEGARRLGAAFQKVNFLRDLGDDCDRLGRTYLPAFDPDSFSDADKDAVADEIEEDLRVARLAISRLPRRSRRATTAAADLFGRLNTEIRVTPATELRTRRVSVPTSVKLRILARALSGRNSS
ncbi:phytoene/squalene synthase family protein [uncultured Microbacterium sp.]|uniref:phytoene/squalene synthase family protein n=1 Tax=uncultured Microbacterium sp. TaxID=191216 RepID=UPI002605C043|nr:phytoene/squalene synthase family protein [uncultured Microbacterium sp.]